jgi:hypothetical protein
VFRAMGRRVHRSRYLHELWRSRDTQLVILSLASFLSVLALSRFAVGFTQYYPYPQLRWPGFNPLLGVALLMLVSPVVFLGQTTSSKKTPPSDEKGHLHSTAGEGNPER